MRTDSSALSASARLPAATPSMGADAFDDLLPHRVDRVQRQQRLLEHHGHGAAAQAGQRALVEPARPGRRRGSRRHRRAAWRMQAHQGAQRHALAGARFADQRHGFARRDVERYAVDGLDRLAAARERDAQVAHRDGGWLVESLDIGVSAIQGVAACRPGVSGAAAANGRRRAWPSGTTPDGRPARR
jgi:hypothetical protein